MNSTNQPTPHDLFLNVRKAYRLLHEYQRMVLDVILYIQEQLDISDFAVYQRFTDSFRDGTNNLKGSSWVWLPMFCCEFRFWKELTDSKFLSLSFYAISDTGFFEGDVDSNDKEKLCAFAQAEEASTKFAFILTTDWNNQIPAFMECKNKMRDFIKTDSSPPCEIGTEQIGKSYDMSDIESMEKVDEIIDRIIDLAKRKSWPLERKKRPPESVQATTPPQR